MTISATHLRVKSGGLLESDSGDLNVRQVACHSTGSGESVPNATTTTLTLNGDESDPLGMRSGNTVTVPEAGWYQLSAECSWQTGASGYRFLRIQPSSAAAIQNAIAPAPSTNTRQCVSGLRYLAQGETLVLQGAHAAGAALSTSLVHLQVVRVA